MEYKLLSSLLEDNLHPSDEDDDDSVRCVVSVIVVPPNTDVSNVLEMGLSSPLPLPPTPMQEDRPPPHTNRTTHDKSHPWTTSRGILVLIVTEITKESVAYTNSVF